MKAFVLQMTSTPNVDENIDFVRKTLSEQTETITDSVVVLPECFAFFGGGDKGNLAIAEQLGDVNSDSVQARLAAIAKEFAIYLVAGTFPIIADGNKVKPMTMVFDPNGQLVANYQKIHLFDVDVADATGSYRESDAWQPGQDVKYFDTPWGRIGLAICYDLRFPGVFQKLAEVGCRAVVLPSAFTERTGQSHWQVLLIAREIENQIYMLASDQTGVHINNRETHGHSMIVDPWGQIMIDSEKQTGLFGAELRIDKQDEIRRAMPVQQHNKFNAVYKD